MQIVETFFLLTSILFLFSAFKPASWNGLVAYVSIVVLVLHFFIDGYRWQMIPAYLAFFLAFLSIQLSRHLRWLKYFTLSLAILLTVAATVLSYALPVFQFPQPSGEYTVGNRAIYLEDLSREETITLETNDYRRLTVQVWYPSEQEITSPEPYLNEGYKEAFAISKNLPEFMLSHFRLIKTHTEKNLSVANQDSIPLILLSHGLLWNAELYTSLIEEMVSCGYIVAGVDHTYESPMTIFEDNRLYWNQEYMRRGHDNVEFDRFQVLRDSMTEIQADSQRWLVLQEMIDCFPGWTESMNRWNEDLCFVLDELVKMNFDSTHFLHLKIDTAQVGVMGHSWGGAVAVHTAATDRRFKAAVNMDGAQWGDLADTILRKPLLSIVADRNYDDFFTPNFLVYDNVARDLCYEVRIRNTGHADFGDLTYWSKIPQLTETGGISPGRMTQINTSLLINFFDQYVRGVNSQFEKIIYQYPEIENLNPEI